MPKVTKNEILWDVDIKPDELSVTGTYRGYIKTEKRVIKAHGFDAESFKMTHIYRSMAETIRQHFSLDLLNVG